MVEVKPTGWLDELHKVRGRQDRLVSEGVSFKLDSIDDERPCTDVLEPLCPGGWRRHAGYTVRFTWLASRSAMRRSRSRSSLL